MSRRVAVILQPSYLPWLGYFSQMQRSDVFVLYDDVQYDKHSWRNRNRIKTLQGIQWLTVPVLTKGQNWPTNRVVRIDNAIDWRKKHRLSIRQNYGKAPYFSDYFGIFDDLYYRPWDSLLELNMTFLNAVCDMLGLKRETVFSSDLGVKGDTVERLIAICNQLGANVFYEGAAGRDYIDDELFARAGIKLEYQDYRHPVYHQLYGDFVPYMSVVDLLFNCGPKSLEILTQ
jgi:hypothetical protein